MTEIKTSLTTQLQHNDEELVQARKSHEITLVKLHEKQLSLSNMQKKVSILGFRAVMLQDKGLRTIRLSNCNVFAWRKTWRLLN